MSVEVIDEGMCCVDCIQMIANGELPVDSTPERDKELEAISTEWCMGEGDDDEFSWRDCDVCGSSLGGTRFPVVRLR